MATATFDPGQHLTSIKGQDYLEVKWRLVWLRSEHPDADITTKLETHDGDRAVFSARVEVPGGGSATGWGSESGDTFGNYIEKAETKAIGRALAALGFGTQFCAEFDDGPETGMLADAPVQRPRRSSESSGSSGANQSAATGPQKGRIQWMARDLALSAEQLEELSREVTGVSFAELSKLQASRLIDALTQRQERGMMKVAS